MEKRGLSYFIAAITCCLALVAFAYSMGKQAGERDAREVFERTAMERRMAALIDSDHDLYSGDEEFEDDGYLYEQNDYDQKPAETTHTPTAEGFANP